MKKIVFLTTVLLFLSLSKVLHAQSIPQLDPENFRIYGNDWHSINTTVGFSLSGSVSFEFYRITWSVEGVDATFTSGTSNTYTCSLFFTEYTTKAYVCATISPRVTGATPAFTVKKEIAVPYTR